MSCRSLRIPTLSDASSLISMRNHMRERGAFRSWGNPASSVRRVASDWLSASSMALNRSPKRLISAGPAGSTPAGFPAASRSVASTKCVIGRVMCHENHVASSSSKASPLSHPMISEVANGGSMRSSGMTSHSRWRGNSVSLGRVSET